MSWNASRLLANQHVRKSSRCGISAEFRLGILLTVFCVAIFERLTIWQNLMIDKISDQCDLGDSFNINLFYQRPSAHFNIIFRDFQACLYCCCDYVQGIIWLISRTRITVSQGEIRPHWSVPRDVNWCWMCTDVVSFGGYVLNVAWDNFLSLPVLNSNGSLFIILKLRRSRIATWKLLRSFNGNLRNFCCWLLREPCSYLLTDVAKNIFESVWLYLRLAMWHFSGQYEISNVLGCFWFMCVVVLSV